MPMVKHNKGLGRGFEALFEDNNVDAEEETITEIPLEQLIANPYQPRTQFEPGALDDLAASIEKSGVFQPIIVRRTRGNHFEILAGERRFRASKLAKKQTIPAIIREVSDEQMMEVAVLENLQREDLTPIDEAQAYSMLMNNLHLTQAQVAQRMGKSRSYIANYLRLLGLPKEVKVMLQNNRLSMGQARALLAINDKNQLRALAQEVYSKTLTVRQINQRIEEITNPKHNQRTANKIHRSSRKSPFLRASENQLQDQFGTPVSINASRTKRGEGTIEIQYLSNDDLNRLLHLLHVDLD